MQGKIIGIFNHAFKDHCWANDICYYDPESPYVVFDISESKKTIVDELKQLRYERMVASEQALTAEVEKKTAELQEAKIELEAYSKKLEQKVAERTAELVKINNDLQNEINIRQAAEAKKELLIEDLQQTLREVKTLRGLLPICSACKKVRDDKGYWNQIESYISDHSEAQFSHSLCPECVKKLYPDLGSHK